MEHSGISGRLIHLHLLVVLIVANAVVMPTVWGKTSGQGLVEAMRDNVVKIAAEWENGASHNGFGFIVGQQGQELFIATANHVVRGRGPDEIARDVRITFFQLQGTDHPATLLGTSNSRRDLAVLTVRAPGGLRWNRDIGSAERPERSAHVWFVGRNAQWYVPAIHGAVNRIDLDDNIIVDGLNVLVGTSGAPLMTEHGIAGMIISDRPGETTQALSIDVIERAFRSWNHPWGLSAVVPEVKAPAAATQAPETPSEGAYVKKVVKRLPIKGNVGKLFLGPDGGQLYVSGAKNLHVIDLDADMRIDSIEVGDALQAAGMDPSGSRIYLLSARPSTEVRVFDTEQRQVVDRFSYPKAKVCRAMIAPNGKKMLITLPMENSVHEFDFSQNNKSTTHELDAANPCALGMSRNKYQFYVASKGDQIKVFSFYDLHGTAKVKSKASITVGQRPKGIVENMEGTRVYVTNSRDSTVSVIDPDTNNVIATVPVGEGPWGAAVSPDGKWVYVTNRGSGTVSVIDAERNVVVHDVRVDADPLGVVVAPDGKRVYISCRATSSINVLE